MKTFKSVFQQLFSNKIEDAVHLEDKQTIADLLQRSQRSDERFRAIFNSIKDAILICDPQTGAVLSFNEKTSEMFGNICQEAASLNTAPIISDNLPYTQETALELIKQAATLGMQHFECQIRDKSERLFWVAVNLKLASIDGQTQVLVSVQDITDRKTSEQQREILYQVHSAVSSQLDVDLVVHSAVETIVRLTGYPHVCIALPHKDGAHWVVRGAAGSLAAETGATYPIQQGVIGRAIKTGQVQWVGDILDDPDYVREVSALNAPALRSELVVPLRRGDCLHGVLNIESDRVGAFSEDDVRLLQSVADMIALALENARLYGEAQQEISERKQAEEALSASEERLKEAQRIALIGNWELSLSNKYMIWSDEVYRIFEIDPTGFGASYTAFLDAIHPDDRKMVDSAFTTSLENKSPYEIDYRLLMLDGRVKYVHERRETFYDADGHALRSVGTVQDITDRKRAEVAQHESHQLLEGTFASLREAVFIIDAHTASITNCNPAAAEMFGYSREEMLGRTTEFLHVSQASLDTFRKHLFPAVTEKGFLFLPEFKMKRRNGMVFPTEHTVMPLEDEQGIRVGWVSVVRDITERKRSEQSLREGEEKYRRLFDNASLGIFQSSPAGQVISINPAFAHMMGYESPEDAINNIQNVATDLFADPNRRAEILRLIAENPDLKTFENVYRRKDGSTFIGHLNLTSIRNSDGQLVRTEGMVEDITERKQAEAKILAALEEKETLLREVHHRVKNNLQAIIALMEMQSDLIADESARQFLKELEGQARTMSLVYEQLYQSANLARIQMDSYLQQLTFYVLETFGEQRMLQLNLDIEPIELDVAQAMPCGLLVNELFTNILKHAFPSGFQGQPSVQIALQCDGETYRLTVADNGVGLPPGQDWQGSRSMGLYLVNLWATHQLGGTLDVSADSGTAYHITFPKTARGSV